MPREKSNDVLWWKTRGVWYQELPDKRRVTLGPKKREAQKRWVEEQVKFRLQHHQDFPAVQTAFNGIVQGTAVEGCVWNDSTKTLTYQIPSAASQHEAIKSLMGLFLDLTEVAEKARPIVLPDAKTSKATTVSGHTLRWAKRQYRDGTDATAEHKRVLDSFEDFVSAVGNKLCLLVDATDFQAFRKWCEKKKHSNDWYNKRLKKVGTVWRWMMREHSADCPIKLPMWLSGNQQKAHKVKEESSKQVAPELFHEAISRTRNPIYRAAFYLCLNCGLNRPDVRFCHRSQLHLDDATPYYSGERHKMAHKPNSKTFRRIPLLPQTVEALRLLPGDLPFSAISQDQNISERWNRASQGKATLSQLRNCFATAAEEADVSDKLIDRFLGHSRSGDTKKYLDKMPVDHLMPVVEAGRQKFFAKED